MSKSDKLAYINISDDGKSVEISRLHVEEDRKITQVSSIEEIETYIKSNNLDGAVCSSMLDYPNDFTSSRKVLRLVDAIHDWCK